MQDGSLPLNMILDQVGRDKGIDKDVLVEAVEAAILTAAKRKFGHTRELEARFNEETGAIDLYQYMIVVEEVEYPEREISVEAAKSCKLEADLGEELGFQIFYREEDEKKAKKQDKEFGKILDIKTYRQGFGRIAAQTAKQVIIQRVRDAERENIFNEYKDRKGEVIAGIVRRFERNNSIIVDLGRTEAVIPSKEQTSRESYRSGDRIMAYVKDIDREARGPQIVLSRTHEGLLRKLFELEVPEIYEGLVSIVSVARDPGARAKIAVTSRDADVDPVGACVGMRGSRVQAVVMELRGEKIDIVPWDADPARFVCNAIQPAEVLRVIIDDANGSMELVVPDDKLSLAIGRRGQNVRLASQLTGWKLDVMNESQFGEREKESIDILETIEGVDENLARTMYKLGFRTLEEVVEAEISELAVIPGVGGTDAVQDIQRSAEDSMEAIRLKRIREMAARTTNPSERERFLFIRGVGERTIELLFQANYKTVEDIATEEGLDKLALSTGLGLRKARQIMESAAQFIESEAAIFEELRKEAELLRISEAAGETQESDGDLTPSGEGDPDVVDGAQSSRSDAADTVGEQEAIDTADEE